MAVIEIEDCKCMIRERKAGTNNCLDCQGYLPTGIVNDRALLIRVVVIAASVAVIIFSIVGVILYMLISKILEGSTERHAAEIAVYTFFLISLCILCLLLPADLKSALKVLEYKSNRESD